MVLRVIVGAAWSLITGLAGGWLALSPWALSEQPSSGDWTNVTQTQFWTGVGLIALAVVCLVLVAAQLAGALRAAPAGQSSGARGGTPSAGQGANGQEMDAALVALANALVADLNRQPSGPPAQMAPANGPAQTYPQPAQSPRDTEPPHPPQSPLQAERWRAGR